MNSDGKSVGLHPRSPANSLLQSSILGGILHLLVREDSDFNAPVKLTTAG
jgi:hypothetical protein